MVFLFNYVKLIIWSGIYYFQEDKSDIILEIIINNIRNSGCVAIKFTQWILPKIETYYNIDNRVKDNKWFKELEVLYEDCNYHSIEYTKNVYKDNFKSNLLDDYEIIDLLASGSIGQVYKVKNKVNNNIYALKVVHPGMKLQLLFFEYFINILYLIPCIYSLIIHYIPVNLKDFIKDFKIQSNLINEANNCITFYDNYKDNKVIIIPQIYKISENLIIMTYETGEKIHDIDISEYTKYKLLLFLKLFIKSNEAIYRLLHGDLHNGNWKVRIEDGLPKLIIYDFGFCWNIPTFLTKEDLQYMDKAFMKVQENKEETIISFSNACWRFVGKKVPEKYMYEEIKRLKVTTKLNYDDPQLLLNLLINLAREYNVILEPFMIQSVILHIQTMKNFEEYYNSRPNINNDKLTVEYEYYNRRIHDIINICDTYDIFKEYSKLLEQEIIEENIAINELFGTIKNDNNLDKYDLSSIAIDGIEYN